MQEIRHTGDVVLTDRVMPEQIEKAATDPRNMRVLLHKPGSTIQLSDRAYVVQPDGSWKRARQ